MTNIDEMPAGIEMDSLVAEKIMGLELCSDSEEHYPMYHDRVRFRQNAVCMSHGLARTAVPRYSTNVTAALCVFNKLRDDMCYPYFSLAYVYPTAAGCWKAQFSDVKSTHWAFGETPELAICRAALKVVESKE